MVNRESKVSWRWHGLGWLLWLSWAIVLASRFDPVAPARAILDAEPLTSGRHALHAVLGQRLAQAWWAGDATPTWPEWEGGLLATPWLTTESRLAACCFVAGGGQCSPAAYKLGVLLLWLALPVAAPVAARALGLHPEARCCAFALALACVLLPPGADLLPAGDLAMPVGAALALCAVAWLGAYHRSADWASATGLAVALAGVSLILPFMLVLVVPAVLFLYLGSGWRHTWRWHVGLAAAVLPTGMLTAWQIHAAVQTAWLLTQPTNSSEASAAWLADLVMPGPALLLLALGLLGLGLLRRQPHGEASRALAVLLLLTWMLAWFGGAWDATALLRPARWRFAALLLATVPAGLTIALMLEGVRRLCGGAFRAAACGAVALVGGGWWCGVASWSGLATLLPALDPLPRGIPAKAGPTVAALQQHTHGGGRLLWEATAPHAAWAPLLGTRLACPTIGTLSDGHPPMLEPLAQALIAGHWAGRPLDQWDNDELLEVCTRRNVGWIAAFTPATRAKLHAWPLARPVAALAGGGQLFALERPLSYFVRGRGRVERCDSRCLTLADVIPVEGEVILSYHHAEHQRSTSDRVVVGPAATDAISLVPLLRLRLDQPRSRVTIRW